MNLSLLKERKKILGLTNQDIVERSNVPLGTVNKLFAGAVENPRLDTLMAVCRVLGIPIDALIDTPDYMIVVQRDREDWTEEELREIETFKRFLLSRRQNKD